MPVSSDGRKEKVGLRHAAFGGMAPWREIWSATSGWGLKPLLGFQPWEKRELRRSPPRKGEEEWVRYRSG